jgi:hypothetical protein
LGVARGTPRAGLSADGHQPSLRAVIAGTDHDNIAGRTQLSAGTSMKAPSVPGCQDEGMRIDPDPAGPELGMLSQYLDYQRETMLSKTDGLTRQQLAQQHSPSQLTLAGLPDREPWASVDWESDPDWEFRTAAQLEPEQLQSRYRQACERSRHIVSSAAGLDQLSVRALRHGRHFSLRWVLLHPVKETARHAGHADFLREAIDGTVGE